MKTMIGVVVAWGLVFSGGAQIAIRHSGPSGPDVLSSSDFGSSAAIAAVPDQVRLINGQIVHVDGSWIAVSGQVLQVHPKEGVRIRGWLEGQFQDTDFMVVNLPIEVAEGEMLPPPNMVILVKPAGVYTYSTAAGSTRTIRKYDYGVPTVEPPKSPEEIAREKAELKKREAAGKVNALKANEEAAEKGDAYGLLRMAERYRDGDQVETNLLKARVYFERAALAGEDDATNELAKLPAPAMVSTNSVQK